MKNLWIAVLLACTLSACKSTELKRPSKKERTEEVSRIKTQLSVEYMRAGDYRLAVTTIEEALQADHKNEIAWLMRAQIYQYLKVNDKAEESFREALRLKPDSAEINNNYGWFLCNYLNNPNAAIPYFDRALADPTYPHWHKRIWNVVLLLLRHLCRFARNWQERKCWPGKLKRLISYLDNTRVKWKY